MAELCDLSAVEARKLMGRKAISPVELLESCIARIEAVDPAVNAMVARDFDRARQTSRLAEDAILRGDSLPPLLGLPVGVKDLDDVAGLRTTYGSELHRDHVPSADCGMVQAIREAGGIIIGKTNTPEFGAGANTRNRVYGVTGNPFDPSRSAAGSSGGSAVALATGMCSLATGSDTGGSCRNPAAYSGVVGLRPTPGIVPCHRFAWLPLSVLGPMARTVADTRLLLTAMISSRGFDPLAGAVSLSNLAPTDVDLSRLRVAFSSDLGFAPVESQIARAFEAKTRTFRHIFAVASDSAPDCRGSDEAFAILRALMYGGNFAKWATANIEKLGPNIRANIAEAEGYSASDVSVAMSLQTELFARWQEFFCDFDVIITPSVAVSPRPWSELYPRVVEGEPTRSYYHWLALAYAATLVGHPAISIPAGLDGSGMPFGLQLVGRKGGDAELLAIAEALEARLAGDADLSRPIPDIAALTRAPAISRSPGFLADE